MEEYQVFNADDITQEVIEGFISKLMDKGNKVTAINARLRAVFVFLRYCFSQEYDDFCTIRRDMIGEGLMDRDARGYWRVKQ